MTVSKRLRYEIFRRDNNACRYCGGKAPDVQLRIDHVVPKALGGSDDPSNLVTACVDCNSGKSATPPDAAIVANVQDDALRWSAAMSAAAGTMLSDLKRRQADRDTFRQAWDAWGCGQGAKRTTVPLPADWEPTIDRFISYGLPLAVLMDGIPAAMTAKNLPLDSVFKYFCGIAWNRVKQLQEVAQRGASSSPEDDDEDFTPCESCRLVSREELAGELLFHHFKRFPLLFQEAQRQARIDLETVDDERYFPHEDNEVILTSMIFLSELVSTLETRDYNIKKFLERMPGRLYDMAEKEARTDFYKAGEAYVSAEQLAPNILRHIGRIVAEEGDL